MRPLDFRALSRGLAKIAVELRQRASQQPLIRATSERLRAATEGGDWVRRRRDSALELYVLRAQTATGHEVADHIASVVRKRLARLGQTKNFEAAADPIEALHDLRVASRRLRALVDVLEPLLEPQLGRRAKKPLQKITRTVRRARDGDVQIGILQERLRSATSDIERIVLEDLLASASAKRKHESKLVRKQLRRVDFDEVNFTMCAILGKAMTLMPAPGAPTSQWLWGLLEPFAQATALDIPPNDGLEHAGHLHQLRIRLKKLRYALELFEPALGTAFDRLYAPVEGLQDILGHHHDLVVLSEIMQRRRRVLERNHRDTLAQALASIEQQLVEERHALVAEYRHQAFDFDGWRRALRGELELGSSQMLAH